MKEFSIPSLSLVILVGASSSGKTTFAQRFFKSTEIISSDACRALISDDENNPEASHAAFRILHSLVAERLKFGRLAVVDATNLVKEQRLKLLEIAKTHHVFAAAIVMNTPEKFCLERNRSRTDRRLPEDVVRQHCRQAELAAKRLKDEGFRYVLQLKSAGDIEDVSIVRQRLWTDLRSESGPFDIVGDVHGCFRELELLLEKLGYQNLGGDIAHPEGRRLIFLGDLVDRGPQVADVLRLAMKAVKSGCALCVPGNHDVRLLRALQGRKVSFTHGLEESLKSLDGETPAFREEAMAFIDGLVSHYVLDEGRLVVAHAGLPEEFQGRSSAAVREFSLYGDAGDVENHEELPRRGAWTVGYRGRALVVYGHTAVREAWWHNNTVCVDTGCVYGGSLTALRYPERLSVSVPAAQAYTEDPCTLFAPPARPQRNDSLRVSDLLGRRFVATRLRGKILVEESQAEQAFEQLSRYCVDPRWLIYLPPTMSPAACLSQGDALEHPHMVFEDYVKAGVNRVVCETKHMGSRMVVVVCQNEAAAERRFGVRSPQGGACYTRTGRRMFDNPGTEQTILELFRRALTAAGFWEEFRTDWFCFDCEIMPWSFRALGLIRDQYAAVATSGSAILSAAAEALRRTQERGLDVGEILTRTELRGRVLQDFKAVLESYCWETPSAFDLRIAPFHLLASEGKVHSDQTHLWHLAHIARLVQVGGPVFCETEWREVDLASPASRDEATAWWSVRTAQLAEGMVVKPLPMVAHRGHHLLQPALKCRGREYLRLIYGPEYLLPENIERLRPRSLAGKRKAALGEFALGLEALERFVHKRPLFEVMECVMGVLALESEPLDGRL